MNITNERDGDLNVTNEGDAIEVTGLRMACRVQVLGAEPARGDERWPPGSGSSCSPGATTAAGGSTSSCTT